MGRLEEVVQEDGKLLADFGLRLLSIEGGVRAAVEDELRNNRVNPWNVVSIDEKTWDWLRPLLHRLQAAEGRAERGVTKKAAN